MSCVCVGLTFGFWLKIDTLCWFVRVPLFFCLQIRCLIMRCVTLLPYYNSFIPMGFVVWVTGMSQVLIMLRNHLLASRCNASESNHNAEVETCTWLQVSICYWADETCSFLICLLNNSFQNPYQKVIAIKSDFQYRNWWWHWLGRCFHLFIFKSMLSFCTYWHVFPHSK